MKRLSGWFCLAGFVSIAIADRLVFFHDGFRRWLDSPLAMVAVSMISICTVAALVLWGGLPDRPPDRRAYVGALLASTMFTVAMQMLGPLYGWWPGGKAFSIPLFLQAQLYGIGLTQYVAVSLAVHRWLKRTRKSFVAIYWTLLLLVQSAATVKLDDRFIRSGHFIFARGYTIWTDVIYGFALFLLPLFAYETLRRHLRPPELHPH
jgi:hypothetical protein